MLLQRNSFDSNDKMIQPRDLVLWVIDNLTTSELTTHELTTQTKIQKLLYLIENKIKEKFDIDIGYKFADYMSHTGKFDRTLQDDIESWLVTGCLKTERKPYDPNGGTFVVTHNISTTRTGHRYVSEYAEKALKNTLNKEGYKFLQQTLENYNKKSEKELVLEEINPSF